MQKSAKRLITNSNYNDHTEPLFQQHHILTFNNIIHRSMALFMHAYVYGYAPKAFDNFITINNDRNVGYVLRNNNELSAPFPRIEFFLKIAYL